MSDDPPRPRPSPGARPRPGPGPAAGPALHPGPRLTRGERRHAERRVGRRRRTALLAGGGCVLAGVVAAVLVISLSGGGGDKPASRSTHHTVAAAAGARLDNPDLATAFLAGAASDIVAVTTYDYRSLDEALQAGLSVTTGRYRTAYEQALTGPLAAAARSGHVVHEFAVLKLGIGAMNAAGTEATVLIFGQQQVTDDTTHGKPVNSAVTLVATIQRSGPQYLISDLAQDANPGLPPGSPDLTVAADSAATEVVNMLSYRRAAFAADLQRALSGATGALHTQLQQAAAATKAAMTKGGFDLSGTVTAVAVEQAQGDTVTMLVAATVNRLAAASGAARSTPVRYEITVNRTAGGAWPASQANVVDAG